jgi:hypothetical protein
LHRFFARQNRNASPEKLAMDVSHHIHVPKTPRLDIWRQAIDDDQNPGQAG